MGPFIVVGCLSWRLAPAGYATRAVIVVVRLSWHLASAGNAIRAIIVVGCLSRHLAPAITAIIVVGRRRLCLAASCYGVKGSRQQAAGGLGAGGSSGGQGAGGRSKRKNRPIFAQNPAPRPYTTSIQNPKPKTPKP